VNLTLFSENEFMTNWKIVLQQLKSAGICIERGLNEIQIATWERELVIRFPFDYRQMLLSGCPQGLIDWRVADVDTIRAMMQVPKSNVVDAVVRNRYWHPSWGTKPIDTAAARVIATNHIDKAPRLIPVCGRSAMPERPEHFGTPMMSHHNLDIVYTAPNLETWLRNKFLPQQPPNHDCVQSVEFWDEEYFAKGLLCGDVAHGLNAKR
jgi:hypothetical protein